MSEINCGACSELREYAPDFATNGVTESVADSLENNTGFNPNLEVLHENCQDLNNANDCLIGMPRRDIEGYDNCDWKEFIKNILGNIYEVNKALIASECGQWDRLESMCAILNASLVPPTLAYGILPNAPSSRALGSIQSNRVTMVDGISFLDQGVGIRYARLDVRDCAGSGTVVYEWVEPNLFEAYIASGVADGEVIWAAKKSDFQSVCGSSDYLWGRYTVQPFTWYDNIIWEGSSAKKFVGLEIKTSPGNLGSDYIGLVYRGTSYPNDASTPYKILSGPTRYSPRLTVHTE